MKKNKEKVPEFDDIIFRDRNKEYGAYDLRRRYNSTMSISLVAACLSASHWFLFPSFQPIGRTPASLKGSILPVPLTLHCLIHLNFR